MIGRRSKAAAAATVDRLPSSVTTTDVMLNAINDESNEAESKFHKTRRTMWCPYRSVLVTLILVLLFLLMTARWNHHSRTTPVEPCQVARNSVERLKTQQQDAAAKLPRIIHHQWKDEKIPEKYRKWHEAWYKLYPDYTHMVWTDESARQLIQQQYSWFLETYDSYKYTIQRADAARYFYLHHFGGIHVDLDYEPLSSEIFQYLPTDRVGLVESPYKFSEETQNSFMSSPKGDPFWLDLFHELVKNKDKRVLSATGPKLLDEAIRHSQHEIYILPCELFHRIPLGEGKASPFVTFVVRELLARVYPMKQCGDFENPACHMARHYNTAVYVAESGWWDLLFHM